MRGPNAIGLFGAPTFLSSWLSRSYNDAFCEGGYSADTLELQVSEARLEQQRSQRFLRPKLDVAMVPERGQVLLHSPRYCKSQVFPIPVIRSREYKCSARTQYVKGRFGQQARGIQMFYYFKTQQSWKFSVVFRKVVVN